MFSSLTIFRNYFSITRERDHKRSDKNPFPQIQERNRDDGQLHESALRLRRYARELG